MYVESLGKIRNSDNIVLAIDSKVFGAVPGCGYKIINKDNVDEYVSKRNSLEKKAKVLSWMNVIGGLGAGILTYATTKFGHAGKTLSAFASAGAVFVGMFKLADKYECSQIRKLDRKFGIQETSYGKLNFNKDFVSYEKREKNNSINEFS